ncbi:MAG: adenosylcobinamide-GDP ribazoletransferase [Nitrospirae bacterium]|nr:adenosylcobinamide-GDP ribazoletransferase [Nitrospirota bacterium]
MINSYLLLVRRLPGRFLFAFQFLTIIPLPGRLSAGLELNEGEMSKSSAMFPLVGGALGIVLAIFWVVMQAFLPQGVAAVLTVAVLAALSGGLHLDGLSDTIDAIAARKSIEQKIAIMKSGTAGPIGTAAVALLLLAKFQLLANLPSTGLLRDLSGGLFSGQLSGPFNTIATMVFAIATFPVMGRCAGVYAMFAGNSIKREGLGKIFIDNVKLKDLAIASTAAVAVMAVIVLAIAVADMWLPFGASPEEAAAVALGMVRYVLALPALYAFTHFAVRFFRKHLGGLNGDILGAIIEVNEIAYLLILSARWKL